MDFVTRHDINETVIIVKHKNAKAVGVPGKIITILIQRDKDRQIQIQYQLLIQGVKKLIWLSDNQVRTPEIWAKIKAKKNPPLPS